MASPDVADGAMTTLAVLLAIDLRKLDAGCLCGLLLSYLEAYKLEAKCPAHVPMMDAEEGLLGFCVAGGDGRIVVRDAMRDIKRDDEGFVLRDVPALAARTALDALHKTDPYSSSFRYSQGRWHLFFEWLWKRSNVQWPAPRLYLCLVHGSVLKEEG